MENKIQGSKTLHDGYSDKLYITLPDGMRVLLHHAGISYVKGKWIGVRWVVQTDGKVIPCLQLELMARKTHHLLGEDMHPITPKIVWIALADIRAWFELTLDDIGDVVEYLSPTLQGYRMKEDNRLHLTDPKVINKYVPLEIAGLLYPNDDTSEELSEARRDEFMVIGNDIYTSDLKSYPEMRRARFRRWLLEAHVGFTTLEVDALLRYPIHLLTDYTDLYRCLTDVDVVYELFDTYHVDGKVLSIDWVNEIIEKVLESFKTPLNTFLRQVGIPEVGKDSLDALSVLAVDLDGLYLMYLSDLELLLGRGQGKWLYNILRWMNLPMDKMSVLRNGKSLQG